LKGSPKWKPGVLKGEAVRVEYTLPILVSPPKQTTGSTNYRIEDVKRVTNIPKNALIMLDGKEVKQSEIETLDPKFFKAVNVLKGEKAVEKYGQKAKEGAIEIFMKETPPNFSVIESGIGFTKAAHNKTTKSRTIRGTGSKNQSVTYSATDSITYKDGDITLSGKGSKVELANHTGLIFLNGIEKTDKSLLKTLDPNTIESINVLKGESATKKYGDRGKEGVVEITSKKK
jgi:hypothetical protein